MAKATNKIDPTTSDAQIETTAHQSRLVGVYPTPDPEPGERTVGASEERADVAVPVHAVEPVVSSENEDVDAICAQILETRLEMSETIEAIKEKLDPDHIKAEVAAHVQDLATDKAQQVEHVVQQTMKTAQDIAALTVVAVNDQLVIARARLHDAQRKVAETTRRQPWILPALGLAVGVSADQRTPPTELNQR